MPLRVASLHDAFFCRIHIWYWLFQYLFLTNFDSLYFRFDVTFFTFQLLNFVIDIYLYNLWHQKVRHDWACLHNQGIIHLWQISFETDQLLTVLSVMNSNKILLHVKQQLKCLKQKLQLCWNTVPFFIFQWITCRSAFHFVRSHFATFVIVSWVLNCYTNPLLCQLPAHPGESREHYLRQTRLLLSARGYHPPNIHNAHQLPLQNGLHKRW